jgi:diaminopimelate decarboxylase
MVQLARELKTGGFPIEMIDLGGGLGIDYQNQTDPPFAQYAQALLSEVRATGLKLLVEPGRALVGNAGVLITRVIRLKSTPQKTFVVVDAAMNDLIRPCLYDAYHAIEPASRTDRARDTVVDVVGPVCETADFLARDCRLPAVAKDELLVVRGCGAYAATMASNYNSRPRAPEILVDHDRFGVARRRESLPQLWEGETLDP